MGLQWTAVVSGTQRTSIKITLNVLFAVIRNSNQMQHQTAVAHIASYLQRQTSAWFDEFINYHAHLKKTKEPFTKYSNFLEDHVLNSR